MPPGSTLVDAQHAAYGGVPLAPVGSRSPLGDGRWGQADLAGNAAELVLDVTTGIDDYEMPCNDCTSWGYGADFIYRGGTETDDAGAIEAATRRLDPNGIAGARCARAP